MLGRRRQPPLLGRRRHRPSRLHRQRNRRFRHDVRRRRLTVASERGSGVRGMAWREGGAKL